MREGRIAGDRNREKSERSGVKRTYQKQQGYKESEQLWRRETCELGGIWWGTPPVVHVELISGYLDCFWEFGELAFPLNLTTASGAKLWSYNLAGGTCLVVLADNYIHKKLFV